MKRTTTRAGKTLRLGMTTGCCAALAAGAATRMLLSGAAVASASLDTPRGIAVAADILQPFLADGRAGCAVKKDAGDDPDVTDGVLVAAEVRRDEDPARPGAVRIDGGAGVGRVTRPGLDQPVGAAAINSGPRAMIEREVRAACREFGYDGGIAVVIAIPGGEAVAARTFNPHLGIVGGLSVIGTTGIVEPMSARALVDAVAAEMKMLRSEGAADLVITPGNYGQAFAAAGPLARLPRVKCANFVGEALDAAGALGFRRVLVVGHAGKLIKLAGGVMDTHSAVADCRMELLALQAALAGMEPAGLENILAAATVDAAVDLLGDRRDAVMRGLMARIDRYLDRRAGGSFAAGAVMFGNRHGLLGISENALAAFPELAGAAWPEGCGE